MLRYTIWTIFLGLIVAGCATDGGGSSSTAGGPPASSNPAMVGVSAAESSPTNPMPPSTATAEAPEAKQSRQTRIAAGVEEETLDTCIGRIPQNATAGQRMLAEQTCRRDFSVRR
jgi:hypothetical protein